jgi:predicted ribosomally synthesized peptide with nif11-like leader
MEAVKADAGLQEKLNAAADADAVVAIAKVAGFVISAEELQRAQAEISEEDLEKVAGGGWLTGDGCTNSCRCGINSNWCPK